VLKLLGDNCRYDLVIEDDEGRFLKVQCKLGWIDNMNYNDPGGTRTHDPPIKSRLLYQLSYGVGFLDAYCSIIVNPLLWRVQRTFIQTLSML
jgi:hypothetical protein